MKMSLCLFKFFRIFIFLILINQSILSPINDDGAHYFTKYLKANNLEEAKSKALVDFGLNDDISSYAGYFTVNKDCESNLFAWFFENKNKSAPVILWFNGGPGASSLIGLFDELGPYVVQKDLNLTRREYAWTDEYSVLFIDNPVGVGFSYTNDKFCYARNQDMVANDLYSLLKQFFTVFSSLKDNEFYITGESYAGKYIPAIANKIHMNRFEASNYFNFVGVAIGDGFTDPINQLDLDELLHQLNYIDVRQKNIMINKKKEAIDLIKSEKWNSACDKINELNAFISKFAGLKAYYNFLETEEDESLDYYKKFLRLQSTMENLHVGNHNFSDGELAGSYLKEDIPKSMTKELALIVKYYKVLLYSGSLDIIVAPTLTYNFLERSEYPELKNIISQEKRILNFNDTEVAGYIKSLDKFHFIILRNAGHLVPHDQPKNSLIMLKSFIENKLN